MAARRSFYRSCRFGLVMRVIAQDRPRDFYRVDRRSNRLYMNSIFTRNLCGVTVIKTVDPTSTSLESQVCTTIPKSKFKTSEYLWKIRRLCQCKKLNSARELLFNFLEKYWSNESLTKTFNCLLFHAVQEQNNDMVDKVIEKMEECKVQKDGATYYILTLYYTDRGLFDQGIQVLKEMQAVGLKTTSRNYVPLVRLAAEDGKLEVAFTLYEEMKKLDLSCISCYPVLIGGVIKTSDKVLWDNKVLELLQDLRVERLQLNIETLQTIEKWFIGQTSNQWQTSWTTVNSSGICQSCKQSLESGALTEKEHAVLRQHLIQYLWKSIKGRNVTLFTTIGNFVDKHSPGSEDCLPHSLDEYISKTGPYDVVLDALNIGCYGGKGNFNVIKLQEMIKNLVDVYNKKVLVIGAGPLRFWTLKQASKISGLVQDNFKCGVFIIKGKYILDDVYMLLAAVHCGVNTLLVSNDLFQDHSYQLPVSVQTLFKRWCQTNQVCLTRSKEDSKVLFKRRLCYDPIVQTTGNTWHLPSGSNEVWLCVENIKKNQIKQLA